MNKEQKSPSPVNNEFNEYDSFAFHPYNILLFLTLFGIGALFLAFSVSFIYSRVQNDLPPLDLPLLFFFNTFILLGSSGTMVWAKKAYKADDTQAYQNALKATIALSVIFMISQFFAWKSLFDQQIFINSSNSSAYLYLISAMHFLHVIAGLPFLGVFLWAARKHMKEPVSVLVYFSDPEKRLKLRLLTIYWHFLDALWIYLILFFWINSIIR
ncbi:MAG: cytochrome c oxidase subunit 3 [Saprospiraceae bacterium]|nr:cytochrome c oxidase subunit 3 [Saprospiraceae bacterium]